MSFEHPESGRRSAHGIDALLPREIAEKARLDLLTLLLLSVLGAAFIALDGMFATTALAGADGGMSSGGGGLLMGGAYWFVSRRKCRRS